MEWDKQWVAQMVVKSGLINIRPHKNFRTIEGIDFKETVYIWMTKDKNWIRLGTSRKALHTRLKRYERDINNTLKNTKTNNKIKMETEKLVKVWHSTKNEKGSPVLKKQLKEYKKLFENHKGKASSTPYWEALCWVEIINKHGPLLVYIHKPSPVKTAAEELIPYLDIERVLIHREKPFLNRSHR